MELKITIGGHIIKAKLNNSSAAKDFVSLLPATLVLEDYAGTEKISTLKERINTSGSPSGCDADAGEITYYAPWGNLAIFYKDFGYAKGLVKLGKIETGIDHLSSAESFEAKFEIVE